MKRILLTAIVFLALAAQAAEPKLEWTQGGVWNGRMWSVLVPEKAKPGMPQSINAKIDLVPYRGKSITCSIMSNAEGVSKPKEAWNGIKFMLSYQADGRTFYPGAAAEYGTYEWKKLSFSTKIPESATTGTLMLGLQSSYGKVSFNLSTLSIGIEQKKEYHPMTVQYPRKTADMPQLRGVMSSFNALQDADFAVLHDWGVNLIRLQINLGSDDSRSIETDPGQHEAWFQKKLNEIEAQLTLAQKYGIHCVVDYHVALGGRLPGQDMRLFQDRKYADLFIDIWRKIATRFKGNPAVWGYDLLNEPLQIAPSDFGYWELQQEAANAIRQIDPDTPIIFESNGWDTPDNFAGLEPLPLDNVIYQVHMYVPQAYTHQGFDNRPRNLPYPGCYSGKLYDKAALRTALQPVREFQERYGARIYVGEFSAPIWGPNAEQYLKDCIDIFEEYGWDWSYHAFRESTGWSLEHEGIPGNVRSSADNPRKRVLLDAFQRNRQKKEPAEKP